MTTAKTVLVSVAGVVLALCNGHLGQARAFERPERTGRAESGVLTLAQDGTDTVLIPAGSFVMGSDEAEIELATAMCRRDPYGDETCERLFNNELEVHQVMLSAYFIDRTEVTVASYRRCVELGHCRPAPYASGGQRFNRADLPATLVDWNDARAYCQFAGGRLPTEAEWERAARGREGRRFPWGDLYNARLSNHGSRPRWFATLLDPTDDRDGFAELAPVGAFPSGRTPDGIDDLAGNVAEWVADVINANSLEDLLNTRYPAASDVDPKGQSVGTFRVTRGGSWMDAAPWLRGAAREFRLANAREPSLGFRCVHPAKGGSP